MIKITSMAQKIDLRLGFKMMYQYLNNFENSKSSGAPKSRTPLAQLIIFLKNNNIYISFDIVFM